MDAVHVFDLHEVVVGNFDRGTQVEHRDDAQLAEALCTFRGNLAWLGTAKEFVPSDDASWCGKTTDITEVEKTSNQGGKWGGGWMSEGAKRDEARQAEARQAEARREKSKR